MPDEPSPDEFLPHAIEIALSVTRVLAELGIPYLIGGSLASSVHGKPRLTHDADLVADIKEDQVAAFVSALAADFYVDELAIRRAIRARHSFNLIHLKTMYKVDVYIPGGDAWSKEEMRYRELRPLIEGADATARFVSSAEATVLQKLLWFRQGGEVSDKQWDDVLGVLKVQADTLDYDYLRHWAIELGITDLLDRALADAGTINSGNV